VKGGDPRLDRLDQSRANTTDVGADRAEDPAPLTAPDGDQPSEVSLSFRYGLSQYVNKQHRVWEVLATFPKNPNDLEKGLLTSGNRLGIFSHGDQLVGKYFPERSRKSRTGVRVKSGYGAQ
jgi:hypothetical protein